MITSVTIFSAAIDAARGAVAGIPDQLSSVKQLDDSVLLVSQRELSELRRLIDSRSSLVAGEIAFRSRRELGYSGLAQKEGFQSAEKLVQATTGATRRDASTLVTAGNLVHESLMADAADSVTGEVPEGFVVREPWLAAVGAAVANGLLSIEAARAIRGGLGSPGGDGSGVTEEVLTRAVHSLLEAAGVVTSQENPSGECLADLNTVDLNTVCLNADELYRRARELRDELDVAGITEREQLLYSQRSLRRTLRPNGLSRYTLDPDLEMSAWLDDVYDKLTAPRRGGPRFVDPGDKEWSDAIVNDERSTEQYLHDAFLGLLRKGVDVDHAEVRATEDGAGPRRPRIVGSRMPSVRVLVTEDSLRTRAGYGRIEGNDIPISIETVERHVCESGIVPIRFGENGNVIDLGRESRLFSSRQKVALAARDGGCLFGTCDRPASWTEAHHINHWARDGGKTDIADGVLLCRHHHMLVHNNHWEIVRKETSYWLIPPPDIDPLQRPRKLESKSASLRDLRRQVVQRTAHNQSA